MKKYILILNAGSATLKFGLFDPKNKMIPVSRGNFEKIGAADSFLVIGKEKFIYHRKLSYSAALWEIIKKLGLKKNEIKKIGHRVVHGGDVFYDPVLVTDRVWHQIAQFNELAPLHNPANLEVIRSCKRMFPGIKNFAVFDTAFFKKLKPAYYLYALPYEYYEKLHIRRYGFHGISHESVAQEVAKNLNKKINKLNIISVHLGNGCSITAIRQGRAIKTSLGFTPLDGLVMGTRTGDLDAAIPLYLQMKLHKSAEQVDRILNEKSGLLGLSGFTSDMREILKAAGKPVINYHGRRKFSKKERKRARIALDVFITKLRTYIILYAAFLEKVDAIAFTGGIGERSPIIRKMSLQGVKFKKRPKVMVVHANEELAIADKIKNIV